MVIYESVFCASSASERVRAERVNFVAVCVLKFYFYEKNVSVMRSEMYESVCACVRKSLLMRTGQKNSDYGINTFYCRSNDIKINNWIIKTQSSLE